MRYQKQSASKVSQKCIVSYEFNFFIFEKVIAEAGIDLKASTILRTKSFSFAMLYLDMA